MSENAKEGIRELLDGQPEEVTGGRIFRAYFTCDACGFQFSQVPGEITNGTLGLCPNCGHKTGNINIIEIID